MSLPELFIRDSLPNAQDKEERIALLRIYHAAERAEEELASVGLHIVDYLTDPDPLTTARLVVGSAQDLARKLRALAYELEKGAAALPELAAARYQRDKPEDPDTDDEEVPF